MSLKSCMRWRRRAGITYAGLRPASRPTTCIARARTIPASSFRATNSGLRLQTHQLVETFTSFGQPARLISCVPAIANDVKSSCKLVQVHMEVLYTHTAGIVLHNQNICFCFVPI